MTLDCLVTMVGPSFKELGYREWRPWINTHDNEKQGNFRKGWGSFLSSIREVSQRGRKWGLDD